jgi:hypothetical protein
MVGRQEHRWMLIVMVCIFSLSANGFAAEAFPSEALPGVSIGGNLPNDFETSGAVWHSGNQNLYLVSDEGVLLAMNAAGTISNSWTVGGDLEGVTLADPESDFIYLGIEDTFSIQEFNLITGSVTRTFDLSAWMGGGSVSSGLEALTFVSHGAGTEGGYFYAGLQRNGNIFSFELPIASSTTSTDVTHIQTIGAINNVSDISDMHYDAGTDVLYAIFDNANLLRAMRPDGTLLQEWTLPGNDQEGLTLHGTDLYIGEDYGGGANPSGDLILYSNFHGVPEPATMALLGLGGLGLLRRRNHSE